MKKIFYNIAVLATFLTKNLISSFDAALLTEYRSLEPIVRLPECSVVVIEDENTDVPDGFIDTSGGRHSFIDRLLIVGNDRCLLTNPAIPRFILADLSYKTDRDIYPGLMPQLHRMPTQRMLQRDRVEYLFHTAGAERAELLLNMAKDFNQATNIPGKAEAYMRICHEIINDAITFIMFNMDVLLHSGSGFFSLSHQQMESLHQCLLDFCCKFTSGFAANFSTALRDLGIVLCMLFDSGSRDIRMEVNVELLPTKSPKSLEDIMSYIQKAYKGYFSYREIKSIDEKFDENHGWSLQLPFFANSGHLNIPHILQARVLGVAFLGLPNIKDVQKIGVHDGMFRGKMFDMYMHDIRHISMMSRVNNVALHHILQQIWPLKSLQDYIDLSFIFYLSHEERMWPWFGSASSLVAWGLGPCADGKTFGHFENSHDSDMVVLYHTIGVSYGEEIDRHISIFYNSLGKLVKITPKRLPSWQVEYSCPHTDFLIIVCDMLRLFAKHFDDRFPGAYKRLAREMTI